MAKDDADTDMKTTRPSAPVERGIADPWAPLATLRHEIDRMFDDFDLGSWNRQARRWANMPAFGALAPASDLVETDADYRLTMELPGMSESDVELKVNDGLISLRGEKTEERKDETKDYHVSERRYGSFHRTFPLPRGVDAEKIAATVSNGVLTVTLPKSAEAQKQARKIEVTKG